MRQQQSLHVKFYCQYLNAAGHTVKEVYSFRCDNPDEIPALKSSITAVTCPTISVFRLALLPKPTGKAVTPSDATLTSLEQPNPLRTWGSDSTRKHRVGLMVMNPVGGLIEMDEDLDVEFPAAIAPFRMQGTWWLDGPAPKHVII